MKHLYERFAKFALLRAAVFGVIGIVTLMLPQFLQGGVFYFVVGYLLLCGIWSIADSFLFGKEAKTPARFGSIAVAALITVFGILSIVYSRYLIHIAPLYLGGLMLVDGLVYFVAAICTKARMQWLLIILAMTVFMGGGTIVIFTLGFEIVLTLSQVSCITLLLSCVCELAIYLNKKHGFAVCVNMSNHMEKEKTK